MKRVEKTNVVVVRNFMQGQGGRGGRMRRDLYIIDVNKRRKCYNCGGFNYITRYCRSWEIMG